MAAQRPASTLSGELPFVVAPTPSGKFVWVDGSDDEFRASKTVPPTLSYPPKGIEPKKDGLLSVPATPPLMGDPPNNLGAGKRGRLQGIRGKRKETQSVRATLALFPANVASAANTALQTVDTIQLSLYNDWNGFIAVYDKVRLLGGEVHYAYTVTGNTASNVFLVAASAYDEIDNTALPGIGQSMTHRFHYGPIMAGINISTGVFELCQSPQAVTRTGAHVHKWRLPRGPTARNSADNTIAEAGWMSTTDAADKFGFYKYFVPALGAGAIVSLTRVYIMHCEFSSRV